MNTIKIHLVQSACRTKITIYTLFCIYSSWGEQPVTGIKPEAGRASSSKHLLRGVGHVEEAVLILVLFVHLSHGERHAGQPSVVDEQVEGLAGQQRHAVPEGRSQKEPPLMRVSLQAVSCISTTVTPAQLFSEESTRQPCADSSYDSSISSICAHTGGRSTWKLSEGRA